MTEIDAEIGESPDIVPSFDREQIAAISRETQASVNRVLVSEYLDLSDRLDTVEYVVTCLLVSVACLQLYIILKGKG